MTAPARRRERDQDARHTTLARILGLDRGGPPPQGLPGEPLRPLTIPNAVTYVRLVLIPVFLLLALDSGDGRAAAATIVFGIAGSSDFIDGLLARVTGQYSRLGTLLDPLVDRLLVLAGVVVAWRFELLPRWALGLLAAREIVMVVLNRLAMARGVEMPINWPGRLSVTPLLGGLGLAMIAATPAATPLFILGLALSLTASALYVRDGLATRAPDSFGRTINPS